VRKTGIDIVGDVPWGTHLCLFYQTKEDLIDILVPYFEAGLENNEFCMWVTSEPLNSAEAREALNRQVKDLDGYFKKGQIEIVEACKWYTEGGKFEAHKALRGWVEKEREALKRGYDGLRATGNTYRLEEKDWRDFSSYEEELNKAIGKYRMIAICTDCLDICRANEVIDVVSNHQATLIRRHGKWDIIKSSPHKRAEDLLHESEIKYKMLAENMSDVVSVFGMDLRCKFASPSVTGFLGYTVKEALSKRLEEVMTPASFKYHMHELEKDMADIASARRSASESKILELELVRKDRSTVWVELKSNLLLGEDGRPSGILGVARDITTRKQKEEELLLFRNLIDRSNDCISVIDLKTGRFIDVNEMTCMKSGYTKQELLAMCVADIDPTVTEQWSMARELDIRRGKDFLLREGQLKRKDGMCFPIEVSSSIVHSVNGDYMIATARDITDRKKAEEAIKESEKRFKTVFENAIDGILLADLENKKFIMGNKAICEMLGYSPEEIKNIGVEDIHPREYLPYVIEQFEKQAKMEITTSKNLPMKRRDGSVFYADVGASPMVLEGKQYLLGIFRDITGRRKAEEALRNEEERFRIAVETSFELVYEWDMRRSIQWFGKIDEMLGYSPGEFPRTLDAWKDSIHPEDRERVMAAVQAYLDGHAPYNIEYRVRTKDGAFRWWAARGAGARTPDGHLGRWIGTVTDITARKKMEEQLVETARQMQGILDNIPDIAWLKDRKSRFIGANEAFGKACGVRPGDLVGKTDLDIWPRELAERYRDDDREVMKSGIRKRVEEPLVDKDGTVRWIETIKSPVVDGKGEVVGTAGIARDITESRLTREKIENAAEQWRNTFDSISDMISIHDLSYRITRVNRAFASAFGMEPQELIGRTCHELFHETKGPHEICPGKEAIARGKTVGVEFFEPRLGRYLEVVAAPFRDENNAITGFVHIAKDVTEKKEAEAKELQSEKLAVVGELASGVAHEIRNPLANISATAQYVLGKYEMDKALRKHMDVIVRNSESANRIIKDLLDFARPHRALLRMCSMREVVKKTCDLIRSRCAVNRVRIKRRLERRLPSVLMEPDRMEQALMNFMLNAIDAMPKGGILAITAELDPGKNMIVVSIADTGKGIPKKELSKIFNPFFSTKRDGVGLGLSLAHQIIGQHNGSIDVQSEVGQGTTVTVRLPINTHRSNPKDEADIAHGQLPE